MTIVYRSWDNNSKHFALKEWFKRNFSIQHTYNILELLFWLNFKKIVTIYTLFWNFCVSEYKTPFSLRNPSWLYQESIVALSESVMALGGIRFFQRQTLACYLKYPTHYAFSVSLTCLAGLQSSSFCEL